MLVKFAAKAQGISHKERGVPCQDAICSWVGHKKKVGIACVADGHGGSKYFRSDRGAKFAVQISQSCLSDFYETINREKAAFFNRKASDDDIKSNLKQLERNIIYRWRKEVEEDVSKDPLTESEKEICRTENIEYADPSNLIVSYGTTLLASLVSSKGASCFWFVLQIGDGLCVMLKNDGVELPIPEDERLAFGRTTSLCDIDAIQNFRESFGVNPLKGITLATDGVVDSFEPEKYLKFNQDIYENFTHNTVQTENDLQKFLPELSKRGSGDDVAIAGIFRAEKKGVKS
jgi:serine/threonine protein phosphatase PrpC